jgi:hypothetical protein
MPQYAVSYQCSKAKKHVEFVVADNAEAARGMIVVATIEGVGGKYVTCTKITKVERVG